MIDPTRNLRLSPAVLIGGYVDHRQGEGAIIWVRGEIDHLNKAQVRQAITYLQACIAEPCFAVGESAREGNSQTTLSSAGQPGPETRTHSSRKVSR